MSATESILPTPPIPKRNPLALLLGVVIKPKDPFTYLRDQGVWSWLLPVALVLALTLASRAVAIPIERAQMEAALAELQEQIGNQPADDRQLANQNRPGD